MGIRACPSCECPRMCVCIAPSRASSRACRCVLREALLPRPRPERASASERAGLIAEDDDDEDEGPQVV